MDAKHHLYLGRHTLDRARSATDELEASLVLHAAGVVWPWMLLTLAGSLYVLTGTLDWGFGYDQGYLHYMAWLILQGGWLYVDVWDTAFPGGPFIHVIAITLGGETAAAMRVLDVVMQVTAVILIFLLAHQLSTAPAAAFSSLAYVLAYVRGGYYHTAQRDGFIVPFLMIAVWFTMKHCDDLRRRWLVVAGLASGFAVIIRPTYILVVIALAAFLLVTPDDRIDSVRFRIRNASVLLGCSVAPVLCFLTSYALRGDSRAIMEWLAFSAIIFPQVERFATREVLLGAARYSPNLLWIGTALSLCIMCSHRHRWKVGLIMLLTCVSVGVRVIESKGYIYQYLPIFALAAVLSGPGWQFAAGVVASKIRSIRVPSVTVATTAMCLLIVVLLMRYPPPVSDPRMLSRAITNAMSERNGMRAYTAIMEDSQDQAEIAHYLQANSEPDDRIQTRGTGPGIHYAARRLSATRFVSMTPFLCVDNGVPQLFSECAVNPLKDTQERWAAEFLNQIDVRRPVFIVAAYQHDTLAVSDGPSFAVDFPALRAKLDEDYEVVAVFGLWSVFRLTD